jgi:hypothetical protein
MKIIIKDVHQIIILIPNPNLEIPNGKIWIIEKFFNNILISRGMVRRTVQQTDDDSNKVC